MPHGEPDFDDFPLAELPESTWSRALEGALSQEPVLSDEYVPADSEIIVDDALVNDAFIDDDFDSGESDADEQPDADEPSIVNSVLPDAEYHESLYDSPASQGFPESDGFTDSDEIGEYGLDDYPSADNVSDTGHF